MHERFDRGLDLANTSTGTVHLDLTACSAADQQIGKFFQDQITEAEEISRDMNSM